MGKYDPIDIFFIGIICAYFLTIICIGLTAIILYFHNKKSKKIVELEKVGIKKQEDAPIKRIEKVEKEPKKVATVTAKKTSPKRKSAPKKTANKKTTTRTKGTKSIVEKTNSGKKTSTKKGQPSKTRNNSQKKK